jgi:hypothetical protein
MSDTKIEHSEEYRTETMRSVEVAEADVRWKSNTVRAFCGFSISSYRDERDREPELRLEPHAAMNRSQWEQMKRLGDLAFAEYEKKWPRAEAEGRESNAT